MEATCLVVSGRAFVIGSLALSRIWYVAFLVHIPLWVHGKLTKLIFLFFLKGKGRQDLVAWVVVTQPPTAGGFSVADKKLKVAPPAGSVGTALCLLPVWLGDFLFLLGFCSISCHY